MNKWDYCKTFAKQQNIATHHDMSSETFFMLNNQTNSKIIHLTQQFIKCKNSIPFMLQPKRELVGLLQQSIPFHVDLVYIMVHFSKFSFIKFVALSTEKSSSLLTIILKEQKQSKHIVVFIFNRVYFSPRGD